MNLLDSRISIHNIESISQDVRLKTNMVEPAWPYTPYEGPNLANENSWKLVVFYRKLGEDTPYYVVIW